MSQLEGQVAQQVDIGKILQAPMEDKEWLKKCLLIGLFGLIPIAGALNAMGWMRTYADNRMRGDSSLPPASLDYMGAGWRLFLMYLPIVGLLFLLEIVIFGAVAVSAAIKVPAIGAIVSMIGSLAILPAALWINVMAPGMIWLHISKGEPWASLQFKKQWRLMMAGGVDYLLLWVSILIAGIIGQLGFIACGLGLFISFPYALAMQGAAMAEFERAAGDRASAAL